MTGLQDHGHIQLVQELAVDQQALHPAAFVDEAHALIQGDCPAIVGHHVELDPMQATGGRPALCLLQQSSADASAGTGSRSKSPTWRQR
jgi:hypothetical protein